MPRGRATDTASGRVPRLPSLPPPAPSRSAAAPGAPPGVGGSQRTSPPSSPGAKPPADLLRPMEGYWIHSPADQTWTLVNDPDPGCVGSGGVGPAGPACPEQASQQ